MGPELIADRLIVRHGTPAGQDLPWQGAVPRVHAYLGACGVSDGLQREEIVAEILARLHSLLPLHQGENPVEIAMRETVQWVEDHRPHRGLQRSANAGPATPPRAELAMPEQCIELRSLRWTRKVKKSAMQHRRGDADRSQDGAALRESSAKDLRHNAAARGIRARRVLFASLIVATTAGAIALLSGSTQQGGLSPLEFLLVLLYAVMFAWICTAFWTALIGFIIRCYRIRRFDLRAPARALPSSARQPRTALIMPIYNETPQYVFARIRAIWESLMATGAGENFDLFILSDTRDPEIQVAEELRWEALRGELGAMGRIFYRNRRDNVYRKAGNIADFVRSWGGRYRYMTVLDADSLMAGSTILSMVEMLEAHPEVAVLQAPPVPVNNHSLFARLLQFGAALYGPLYTAGMNFWQASDASYFGHNAVLRVEPFAAHCGLPSLPGKEPLGGPILSHDFVEAATLRRAGWEAWLVNDLDGSFEEVPPTLIDYAKRDRRWCQGNLQHGRLLAARGWRGLTRLHFGMAVMSYVASPLWFLFLLAAGVEAWLQTRETPVYFFGDSLFPVWPISYAFELMTVLLVTLTILFLPKLLALVLLLRERERWRYFGGPVRATMSVVLESLFSVVTAPVLMVFQTKFVAAILLHRNVGWPTQQREDRVTTWSEALRAHGSQLLLGVAAGLVTWFYVPGFFWWFTPVLAGLVLAVPVSVLTSRSDLGRAAARLGLLMTPQEVAPAAVVRRYRAIVELPDAFGRTAGQRPRWLAALIDPRVYHLHRMQLPPDEPTRRQRHQLDGLMYTLIDQGEDALDIAERRAMIGNATCLKRIHIGLWSELPLERLAVEDVSSITAG
jgi:membrane glycosyltransferase